MNAISFVTANYVARELGYHMTAGWGQGVAATRAAFSPIETFGARFEALLREIKALDFNAIDLWVEHLHPAWATPDHVTQAQALLDRYELRVTSFAGGAGATRDEFEAFCRLAQQLDVPVLAGNPPLVKTDRAATIDLLARYGRKLGLENHPEKTPAELRAAIGNDGNGTLGAAIDTGWWGTQGYDAAQAIEELGDVVFAVHLKDVRAAGAHDTCRYGQGVVPLERCVRVLHRIGYRGPISVEHEPETFDPTDDVRASYAMLRGWLTQ